MLTKFFNVSSQAKVIGSHIQQTLCSGKGQQHWGIGFN